MDKDDETDIFVWIDYGIFKQHHITADAIRKFLFEVALRGSATHIAAPGLIDPAPVDWGQFHTRFCGSVVVIPRALVDEYRSRMGGTAALHMINSRTLSWEVNYLAEIERDCSLPIRQYKAWWDASQFTNY